MNFEEFRETFLRNDRGGPTKAEKAGEDGGQQRLGKKLEKRKFAATCCNGKRGQPSRISAIGWGRGEQRSQRSQKKGRSEWPKGKTKKRNRESQGD